MSVEMADNSHTDLNAIANFTAKICNIDFPVSAYVFDSATTANAFILGDSFLLAHDAHIIYEGQPCLQLTLKKK